MRSTRLYTGVVQADWLDELDHMNFLQYQRVADQATGLFWAEIGGEEPSAEARLAFVIVETHVRYQHELRLGDPVDIETRLIGHDHRRVHLHHSLLRGDEVVSIVQVLGLAFDVETRRAGRWTPEMLDELVTWPVQDGDDAHRGLMNWVLRPSTAGRAS